MSTPSRRATDRDRPLRVAVVFASAIMRRGCVEVLREIPSIDVVAECRPDAADALCVGDVDVAVVGLVPDVNSDHGVVSVLAAQGHRVLAVIPPTMRGAAALAAGAHSYVAGGDVDGDDLARAIIGLLDGSSVPVPGDEILGRLSQREREVLACLASGCTDREIGERLGISSRTVQSHLDRIRHKTRRRRRAELTSLAYELGLVPDGA